MANKPGWVFWGAWAAAYFLLDLVVESFLHAGPHWSVVPGAFKDALLGATLTWFLALWTWYKRQDRF